MAEQTAATWTPIYSRWRHGGWYIDNLHYPSGAIGCVSRNYPDKKWRIACDDRPNAYDLYKYADRDAAARAEYEIVQALKAAAVAKPPQREQPPALTPIEFADIDHDRAQEIAERLGYEQTAYTSSSALWGLFCLPENPANLPHSWRVAESGRHKPPFVHGCVIKLREFGLVFIQTADDLGFEWKD